MSASYKKGKGEKTQNTYPASSFWILVRGLLLLANPDGGEVGVIEGAPPPPRKGLAMRPKLIGEDATAFEAI